MIWCTSQLFINDSCVNVLAWMNSCIHKAEVFIQNCLLLLFLELAKLLLLRWICFGYNFSILSIQCDFNFWFWFMKLQSFLRAAFSGIPNCMIVSWLSFALDIVRTFMAFMILNTHFDTWSFFIGKHKSFIASFSLSFACLPSWRLAIFFIFPFCHHFFLWSLCVKLFIGDKYSLKVRNLYLWYIAVNESFRVAAEVSS